MSGPPHTNNLPTKFHCIFLKLCTQSSIHKSRLFFKRLLHSKVSRDYLKVCFSWKNSTCVTMILFRKSYPSQIPPFQISRRFCFIFLPFWWWQGGSVFNISMCFLRLSSLEGHSASPCDKNYFREPSSAYGKLSLIVYMALVTLLHIKEKLGVTVTFLFNIWTKQRPLLFKPC